MNSKKSLVALASIAFALVVAGPVSAACSVATLSECDNTGLMALIAQMLGGQTTTQTGTTATGNAPAACAGVTFTRNLSQGSSGADVKCLQALLNQAADTQVAATGVGSAGNESTYFGAKTTAAVKAFQTKYGISPVAGFVGSITRAKLNELLATGTGTGTGTGLPTGCTSTSGYSPTTGQSCATGSVLPAGCTTASGYSPTTGLPCSGTGTGTVAGQPLTVALAGDTPVGGNVLRGEANKTVTKLTLTAAADADAVISSLKVKSYGTAALNNTDITTVKIYNNGSQLGTAQSMVSGVATFTFAPSIVITKGTAKTLDVVVSVSTTAVTSATVKMGIADATSIGGTTFAGTYPVVGNAYTIIAGGSLGTLRVTNGVIVPVTSVQSGSKDVELGNFVVSAGTNEDVSVNQFVVAYLGTPTDGTGSAILDTDVTNIRVTVDGVVQGTASSFSSRKATVNFTTPLVITKGSAKTLKVLGDITSGVGRAVELQAGVDSVSGVGLVSGVGVAGPATALSAGASNEITIGRGSLTASISSATPQGTAAQFVKSTSAQTLGVFDIRAVGEDVLVSSLGFKITGPASITSTSNDPIVSVGLYSEAGALVSSNQVDFTEANLESGTVATDKYFNLSVTIPANTTQKFYVKGITNGLTLPDPTSFVVALVNNLTGTKAIIGTGMNSSAQEGADNVTLASTLGLPAISVNQGPTATVSGDPLKTPLNQSVMEGAQVTVGTVKITAQREDQTLRSIVLTGVPSTSTMAGLLNQVTLYDYETGVQLTNSVAPSGNTVTFAGTDVLTPAVTFVKGTAKTLKIVANAASGNAGYNFYWTIAATSGHLTTVGKTSGQLYQSATAADLRVSSGSTAAGTYTINPIIVEVLKDAASPSGTVGRGTYQTYATWKLDSYGTTSDVNVTSVTFYSKVGLPSGATSSMFRLVDADTGTAITVGTTTIDATAGTAKFDMASGELTITNGVTTRVSLQITTTNTTAWAANTAMQWTVIPASSVTIAETGAAVGSSSGVNYSIPADTNLVNIGA